MEALLSICRKTDNENVVYPYNGILSTLKIETNIATCYNIDGFMGYYVQWNKPVAEQEVSHDPT
jgi:hypothetical protein